jgi:hypothetical protein
MWINIEMHKIIYKSAQTMSGRLLINVGKGMMTTSRHKGQQRLPSVQK